MIRIRAVAVAALLAVTTSESAPPPDRVVVNKVRSNANLPGNLAPPQ